MHSYDAMELQELRGEVQRQRGYIKVFRDKVCQLEDLLARVYNELGDPTGVVWCDRPRFDRELLAALRDEVGVEMGWDE